jgi:hypothetical protein
MASRALTARFRIATSSWFGSACAFQGPAAKNRLDCDLFAKAAPQQIRHAAHQAPEVDRLGLQRLLTGESEKPLRQRFGAARALHGVRRRMSQSGRIGSGCAR